MEKYPNIMTCRQWFEEKKQVKKSTRLTKRDIGPVLGDRGGDRRPSPAIQTQWHVTCWTFQRHRQSAKITKLRCGRFKKSIQIKCHLVNYKDKLWKKYSMWNRRMLIADCKGRIETIEMRFGFDHGEELQLVKYPMCISHSVLVQSLFTGLFYFLQKHAIAI